MDLFAAPTRKELAERKRNRQKDCNHLDLESGWEEVDLKIERLKKLAAEKSKFDKIKSAISGEVVMSLRNIGPGKEVGRIIEKTLEHIINEGLDIENDKEKIQEFILCI